MQSKKKLILQIGALSLGLSLLSLPALAATDYSNLSNSEMNTMRGTMRDASQEERNAFRSEWQKRQTNMTQEEKQNYRGRPTNAPHDGSGSQYGRGGGAGGGMGGGMGRGGGRR